MDFPETLTIEVTQDDIENGAPKSAFTCAVALATNRLLGIEAIDTAGNLVGAGVTPNDIEVWDENSVSAVYPLPLEAAGFVRGFDRSKKGAKPFTFTTLPRIAPVML